MYSPSKRTAVVPGLCGCLTCSSLSGASAAVSKPTANITLACPQPRCFHTARILLARTIQHPCVSPSYLRCVMCHVLIGSSAAILVLAYLWRMLTFWHTFCLIFKSHQVRLFLGPHTNTLLLLNHVFCQCFVAQYFLFQYFLWSAGNQRPPRLNKEAIEYTIGSIGQKRRCIPAVVKEF